MEFLTEMYNVAQYMSLHDDKRQYYLYVSFEWNKFDDEFFKAVLEDWQIIRYFGANEELMYNTDLHELIVVFNNEHEAMEQMAKLYRISSEPCMPFCNCWMFHADYDVYGKFIENGGVTNIPKPDLERYEFDTSKYVKLNSSVRREAESGRFVDVKKTDEKGLLPAKNPPTMPNVKLPSSQNKPQKPVRPPPQIIIEGDDSPITTRKRDGEIKNYGKDPFECDCK